jgi:Family of unknown function (DUF6279)
MHSPGLSQRTRTLLRTLIVVAATLLLSSCKGMMTGVAYNKADWLLQRVALHYVDLDREQAAAARARLQRLHAWHRTQELPRYAALMEEAAIRVERGIGREDVDWAVRSVRERWRALAIESAGAMAPVLLTLRPAQLAQLEKSFAEDNARFIKTRMTGDSADAMRERSEWLTGQVSRLLGDLTAEQAQRVDSMAAGSRDYPAQRLAERRRKQAAFVALLNRSHEPDTIQAGLIDLLSSPSAGASQAYRQSSARYEDQFVRMVVDLDRSMTPVQRATVAARLRRYAADFRAWAARRSEE